MDIFPRTLTVTNGSCVTIDLAKQEDLDEITEFVRQHYFSPSPMCYFMATFEDDVKIKDFVAGYLNFPINLTARDSNGKLLAVVLNELLLPSSQHVDGNMLFKQDEKALVMSIVESLEENLDMFEKFNTDKLFSLTLLSVDQSYGRLGLGNTLVAMSVEVAQFYDAGAAYITPFNSYVAKIAAKQGFETIKSIDYATYELDGKYPLADQKNLLSEHTIVRIMAKILPQSK